MAMGTRKMRERQEDLWYGGELPTAPGHPFYKRLNEVLENARFDPFCETNCASFYHNKLGRPSLPPGQYFRVAYYIALKRAEVPAEMHLYAQGGHAFGLRRTKFPITGWPQLVEAWLGTIGMV